MFQIKSLPLQCQKERETDMKVYKFTTKELYSGGCVLVAAESEEQAKDFIDEYTIHGMNGFYSDGTIENLEYKGDMAEIIVNHTYFE